MKLACALSTILAAGSAWGQADVPAPAPASVVDCRRCHTSDAPTKEKPSLVRCPRNDTKGVHSAAEAPRTITLGSAGGQYGPVEFSHKAHAEMSEMGGGCYRCHHYDQGGPIEKCERCHSATRARADLGKPDLKAAVHRLCIDCHREWSHSTDCAVCHGKKVPAKPERPRVVVYRTDSDQGKFVTFPHGDHAGRFGLKCADCHQQRSCAGCHDPAKKGKPPLRAKGTAAHESCSACHANDKCSSCHSEKPAGAFDHGKSTGWSLNRFHGRLECSRCHTTAGKFTKLDNGCDSCHKGWQAAFDHKKTGLALDETHSSLGCENCHADKEFAAPPACPSCHDRSYPKDKPGTLVGGKARK
ncbi:MAG: cytochrome c3 family protein [Elusimicrobiota bacterium]